MCHNLARNCVNATSSTPSSHVPLYGVIYINISLLLSSAGSPKPALSPPTWGILSRQRYCSKSALGYRFPWLHSSICLQCSQAHFLAYHGFLPVCRWWFQPQTTWSSYSANQETECCHSSSPGRSSTRSRAVWLD